MELIVPHDMVQFSDEPLQEINCSGTDIRWQTEEYAYIKHEKNWLKTNRVWFQNMQKPKPTRQSSLVRTAHISVLMTVHNRDSQYSTEQFW